MLNFLVLTYAQKATITAVSIIVAVLGILYLALGFLFLILHSVQSVARMKPFLARTAFLSAMQTTKLCRPVINGMTKTISRVFP